MVDNLRDVRKQMNALDQIRSTADGIAILHDWLGEGGKPVEPGVAHHRAEICVSCPFNSKEGYLRLFKQAAGEAVKRHLEVKHSAELTTEFDDELNLCTACSCVLLLKIWTPFSHIRAFTSDKQFNRLPSFCWQIKALHAPVH